MPALGASILARLAPRAGERILDLGCGDGVLTAELVASGAEVVAVDGSPQIVAAAVARGIAARVMDARALTFTAEFDAVFSNAVLHWIPEADAVLILNCPTAVADSTVAAEAVIAAVRAADRGKPVFTSWIVATSRGVSDESGPSTMIRDGPNRA